MRYPAQYHRQKEDIYYHAVRRYQYIGTMKTRPYIVGISGGSGSGKTTFIEKLSSRFGKQQLCIVSMDNYYRPREEQEIDENGVRNFDRPESIDSIALYRDIQKLASGMSYTRKEYTFNNPLAEATDIVYNPAPVIIVEGLFIFHEAAIWDLLDLRILIDADNVKKLIRRVKRDATERNYPLDDVLYRYEHHVLPSYDQYIAPYKKDIDVIINNNSHFDSALDMVAGYLLTKT